MAIPITPLVSSPSGEISHLDVRERVNLLSTYVGTNLVYVYSESNFPAVVGNYHPLAADTTYILTGDISLSAPLDFGAVGNNPSLISLSTSAGSLTYSGNLPLIKSTGSSVEMRLITASHPSANLFDVDGAQDVILKAPECTFSSLGGGMAGGLLVCDFEKTTFFFTATSLQIDGTNINLLCNQIAMLCTTADGCLNLQNGTYTNIRIKDSQFYFGASGFGISSQSNSSNIVNIAKIDGCDFIGAGTPLLNITNTDLKWLITGNAPQDTVPDTIYGASCYIDSGGSQTTVINNTTPLLVAGSYTVDEQNQFTVVTSGRMTYDGLRPIERTIIFKSEVTPAAGSNKEFEFYIAKNGAIQLKSFAKVNADATNPQTVIGFAKFEINTGDYFEVYVKGVDGITNVTCSALSFTI